MRAVIAEDAVLLREGLQRLLTEGGFDVVDCVADGEALLRAVERHQPDVCVVDIRMPPTFSSEGLEAAQRIRGRHPAVGVLLLSQHIDAAYAMKLVDEGAERVGYLLKDRIADIGALTSALERVRDGESVVDPALVAELLDAPRQEDPLAELTPRERDVLALVAEGRTDRGIAAALWLSPKTVETHVRSIFRKLDLPTAPTENRRVHAVLAFLHR
jgi:DNA-binding NarL/FixJ family response regulator